MRAFTESEANAAQNLERLITITAVFDRVMLDLIGPVRPRKGQLGGAKHGRMHQNPSTFAHDFQVRGSSRAQRYITDRLCAVRMLGQPHVLLIDSAWSDDSGSPDAKRRSDQGGDDRDEIHACIEQGAATEQGLQQVLVRLRARHEGAPTDNQLNAAASAASDVLA